MIDFSKIENGSQFVRADLHIHSFGKDRGSVDNEKYRKISCAILEGGERAFKRRRDIYGI